MADLDRILDGLDERRIAQEIELRVEMALKGFPVSSPVVQSYPEMEILAAKFYQDAMEQMDGAKISDTAARGFIALLLPRAFSDGIAEAADVAITGVHGGVMAILRKVADAISRQLVEQHVSGTIAEGVDMSNRADKVELMSSYIDTIKPNMPSTEKHKYAEEMAGRPERVLKNHMQIESSLRKTFGKR